MMSLLAQVSSATVNNSASVVRGSTVRVIFYLGLTVGGVLRRGRKGMHSVSVPPTNSWLCMPCFALRRDLVVRWDRGQVRLNNGNLGNGIIPVRHSSMHRGIPEAL